MNRLGFSWRQTTVAKTEAADRPLLFVEAAALARLFRRDISFFLSEWTAVDALVERLEQELEQGKERISQLESDLSYFRRQEGRQATGLDIAKAVREYQNSSDSGVLRDSLDGIIEAAGQEILQFDWALKSCGISRRALRALDKLALTEALTADQEEYAAMSVEELSWYDAGTLAQTGQYLEGGAVDADFLASVRDGKAWRVTFGQVLVDLLVERISQSGADDPEDDDDDDVSDDNQDYAKVTGH